MAQHNKGLDNPQHLYDSQRPDLATSIISGVVKSSVGQQRESVGSRCMSVENESDTGRHVKFGGAYADGEALLYDDKDVNATGYLKFHTKVFSDVAYTTSIVSMTRSNDISYGGIRVFVSIPIKTLFIYVGYSSSAVASFVLPDDHFDSWIKCNLGFEMAGFGGQGTRQVKLSGNFGDIDISQDWVNLAAQENQFDIGSLELASNHVSTAYGKFLIKGLEFAYNDKVLVSMTGEQGTGNEIINSADTTKNGTLDLGGGTQEEFFVEDPDAPDSDGDRRGWNPADDYEATGRIIPAHATNDRLDAYGNVLKNYGQVAVNGKLTGSGCFTVSRSGNLSQKINFPNVPNFNTITDFPLTVSICIYPTGVRYPIISWDGYMDSDDKWLFRKGFYCASATNLVCVGGGGHKTYPSWFTMSTPVKYEFIWDSQTTGTIWVTNLLTGERDQLTGPTSLPDISTATDFNLAVSYGHSNVTPTLGTKTWGVIVSDANDYILYAPLTHRSGLIAQDVSENEFHGTVNIEAEADGEQWGVQDVYHFVEAYGKNKIVTNEWLRNEVRTGSDGVISKTLNGNILRWEALVDSTATISTSFTSASDKMINNVEEVQSALGRGTGDGSKWLASWFKVKIKSTTPIWRAIVSKAAYPNWTDVYIYVMRLNDKSPQSLTSPIDLVMGVHPAYESHWGYTGFKAGDFVEFDLTTLTYVGWSKSTINVKEMYEINPPTRPLNAYQGDAVLYTNPDNSPIIEKFKIDGTKIEEL